MKITRLNETVAVADQISPDDIAVIAEQGYGVLVNNRPDGEVPGQPSSAMLEAAARAGGLEYHYFPVTARDFPGSDLPAMAELFASRDRAVLAFCRTGTRSTNLWVAAQQGDAQVDAAVHARQLGYDLAMSDGVRARPAT